MRALELASRNSDLDLSVIVVNWNTRDLLSQCLMSIYDTVTSHCFEVIVVDNGSIDDSVQMLHRDFPQVIVLGNNENLGFVRANNQALSESRGRYVLLLNSDAVLLPRAVTALMDSMQAYPDAGIVGPKILNPDGTFQSSYMDFPNLFSELLLMSKLSKVVCGRYFPSHSPRKSLKQKAVDWISGACMMIRREILEEIGGLDETYFMYSEEVDWCWRARQAGWHVYYVPEASVLHWGGQSSTKVSTKRRSMIYRSKYLFLEKHYGLSIASLFRVLLLVSAVLKLGLWGVLYLLPNTRVQATSNVRSYQQLIATVYAL